MGVSGIESLLRLEVCGAVALGLPAVSTSVSTSVFAPTPTPTFTFACAPCIRAPPDPDLTHLEGPIVRRVRPRIKRKPVVARNEHRAAPGINVPRRRCATRDGDHRRPVGVDRLLITPVNGDAESVPVRFDQHASVALGEVALGEVHGLGEGQSREDGDERGEGEHGKSAKGGGGAGPGWGKGGRVLVV